MMDVPTTSRRLRIGIDVGGTNTDGVILDPARLTKTNPEKAIVAWHKTPTTADPSAGISNVVAKMFETAQADVKPEDVASMTIGTTHFVNALAELDARRLSRVAVLRLSCAYSKHAPPCVDWPAPLRSKILGHYALLSGGLEVDGSLIASVSPEEVERECAAIREKGIRTVVVNGVFSPIDTSFQQEEEVGRLVAAAIPEVDVVLSKHVANLGFLERENAAILNASILALARRTVYAFRRAAAQLGLTCPIFITANDGSIISCEQAARLPIRTFLSGPANSMRGAAFMVGEEKPREPFFVVDIGGTTSDIGLLLPNGFPRQQAAYSELAGVRMNFPCPDIKSIALGGGSIVSKPSDGAPMSVGPESVGYRLQQDALIFGGSQATATDYLVAGKPSIQIGNPELVNDVIKSQDVVEYAAIVKSMLEKAVDAMKTSPEDVDVIVVGGGAILAPDEMAGARRVLKPTWSGIANAIGAATGRISSVIDKVESTEKKTTEEHLKALYEEVTQKAVAAGAKRETVEIVEVDTLPLEYVSHKTRFIVRAAGEPDFSKLEGVSSNTADAVPEEASAEHGSNDSATEIAQRESSDASKPKVDAFTYKPKVLNREWLISETDVDWISCGCYILGTGGGGSPYSSMLRLREILRAGGTVRVVSPSDLADDAVVGCGGGAGSPTVAIEKLPGDEMMEAQEQLYELYKGKPASHMISMEIGGANGLQGMILGASTNMDVPAVDGDWMGRAYPTKWQTTPVVFGERKIIFCPVVMCDGKGNVVYMPKASSDAMVERVFRAGLAEMGSLAGCAEGPVTGAETKRWAVENTISLSWRIGRAVARARQANRLDGVAEAIIGEVGGDDAAKVLFKGKIVGVERRLHVGHVYGEVIIEGEEGQGNGGTGKAKFKIPFKNENIAALRMEQSEGGSGSDGKDRETLLAVVPDLIAVIDARSGEAVGTPEYRYGLHVLVLAITASDRWTSTPRALDLGGPKAFGFDHLAYRPVGRFVKPRSVIDEFDVSG